MCVLLSTTMQRYIVFWQKILFCELFIKKYVKKLVHKTKASNNRG